MASAGMMYRQTTSGLLVPTQYQFGASPNPLFQVMFFLFFFKYEYIIYVFLRILVIPLTLTNLHKRI